MLYIFKIRNERIVRQYAHSVFYGLMHYFYISKALGDHKKLTSDSESASKNTNFIFIFLERYKAQYYPLFFYKITYLKNKILLNLE